MLMIAVVCHTQHMLRNIFWGFSRAANSIWSCIEVTGLISKLIFCNISIFECLSQILREIISLIIRILFYSQSNRIYLLPTLITRDIFLNHAEPHRGLNILSSRLFCCVVSTNAKSLSSLLWRWCCVLLTQTTFFGLLLSSRSKTLHFPVCDENAALVQSLLRVWPRDRGQLPGDSKKWLLLRLEEEIFAGSGLYSDEDNLGCMSWSAIGIGNICVGGGGDRSQLAKWVGWL